MDSISDGIYPEICYASVDPEQLAFGKFQENLKYMYERMKED